MTRAMKMIEDRDGTFQAWDGTGNVILESFQGIAGEAIVAGDPLAFDDATPSWKTQFVCDGNGTYTRYSGIALNSAAIGDGVTVVSKGIVLALCDGDVSAGELLYVNDSEVLDATKGTAAIPAAIALVDDDTSNFAYVYTDAGVCLFLKAIEPS